MLFVALDVNQAIRNNFIMNIYNMPIYSLYLNNNNNIQQQQSNNANFSSCTWYVNFDDLFEGANYRYNKCRLRYKIIGTSPSLVSSNFQATSSVFSCNLSTSFNASTTALSTLLNVFALGDTPTGAARITPRPHASTAITKGVNINMPFSNQSITFNINKLSNFSDLQDFGNASVILNYNIHLMFELYN